MQAEYFSTHFTEHQRVVDDCITSLQPASDAVVEALIGCIGRGGKILAFGNGGSATQANHLVEELIGRFKETRRALPAISLVGATGRGLLVSSCRPSDCASRRAGSIVSTTTERPASAARTASAAAVVVLPTPPEPQQTMMRVPRFAMTLSMSSAGVSFIRVVTLRLAG